MGNAVKFTEEGEVVTQIEMLGFSENEVELKINVKDTGIGIEEQQLENIFKAFKQADGSTTRNYGGTGLGLNISRKLVSLMGGDLKVESTLGEGTNFFFQTSLRKGKEIKEQHSFNNKDIKLLLIESNETSQQILKKYCFSLNADLITAQSIEEGLVKLAENKDVNVILADISSESSLKQKVQNLYQSERIPYILALTTDVSPVKLQQIKELEYDSYIYKPLRVSTLCSTVNKLFEDRLRKRKQSTQSLNISENAAEILLVEDNKINQKLALKVLKKMGHNVELAKNGKEAIEMVTANKYDLIFMDVQMPVMGGIEATEALRKSGIETPIIALTANAFEQDRLSCLNAGMNDFASKPLERTIIRELIQKYTSPEYFEEDKDSA